MDLARAYFDEGLMAETRGEMARDRMLVGLEARNLALRETAHENLPKVRQSLHVFPSSLPTARPA